MASAPSESTRALIETMLRTPLGYSNEAALQEMLAAALVAGGYAPQREVVLADGVSRIDILVGRVGVEVKVKGSLPDVRRQLARYARNDDIDELVLVTSRAAHHGIPRTIGGKPLTLCSLIGVRL
jgi:hypothetical protein